VDIDVFWAGIHPDSVAETKEKLEAAVDPAGDGRFDADYLVRPLDGSPHRWVHATGQTIFAGDGANRHPVHVIGTVEDITDRKRAEDALEATVRDLERSNRELEQFAYIASHDLQEPLRQVRAFVGMLKDRHSEKFEGQAQQYFQFVYEGAARMSDLIQGLLAYSRAGAKDAAKRPVSCQKALDTALANLQAGIAESRARVTHDDLPTVLAQPTQLSQLFQNLIGNAVKFRRDGLDPQIHVGCQRDDGHWLFRVTDNGIGIEPEFHEKVFLIFQRLHGRGKYPGTGIGLAICKKIVEQHGGKIWIESKPDEGSTFCFTLPEDRRA
jgi:light-regulated signal transduction histidine kinase (bacteriophytochrome)